MNIVVGEHEWTFSYDGGLGLDSLEQLTLRRCWMNEFKTDPYNVGGFRKRFQKIVAFYSRPSNKRDCHDC